MPGDFDLTPDLPEGRNLIQGYRPEGFTVGGRQHEGAVLVLESAVIAWPVDEIQSLSLDALRPVLDADPRPEILILGSGARFVMASATLRAELRAHGIALECMDSRAACRTFNVLLAEDRRVAAALILPTP